MKYVKKPIVVEAVKWFGNNAWEILNLTRQVYMEDGKLKIDTLEGIMTAEIGDYIVVGIDGEVYPVKEYIFSQTYEPYEENITYNAEYDINTNITNNTVSKTPIYCPKCGNVIAYEEDLTQLVLPFGGLRCPYCGALVVSNGDPIL